MFFGLDNFEIAILGELYGLNIAKQLNMKLSSIQDAQVVVFPPPPVQGLGTIGGFQLQLEDRADIGYDELYKATQAVLAKARHAGADRRVLELRSERAADQRRRESRQGQGARHRADGRVLETLQVYLGSIYVNDFNRFGARTR